MEDWKGLVAWSVSFNAFVAIATKRHPSKFQELLAYHTPLLMEAGCKGWLSYDKMFREHIEKEPTSSWSMLQEDSQVQQGSAFAGRGLVNPHPRLQGPLNNS